MSTMGSTCTSDLVAGTGAADADPSTSTGDPNYAVIVGELSTLKSRIQTDVKAIKSRIDNFNDFMRKEQPAQQDLQFANCSEVNTSLQDLRDELQLKADRINKQCEEIDFAKRELEVLREEKKQWTAQKVGWENEKTSVEREVLRLMSEASNAEGTLDFYGYYDILRQRINTLEAEMKQSDNVIKEFVSLINSKHVSGVPVNDPEVGRLFSLIAWKIQDLVIDYYINQQPAPHPRSLEPGFQRELFETLQLREQLTPIQRTYTIRAVLFRLVDKYILSRRSFGLDDLQSEIETGLDLFEYRLPNLGRALMPQVISWRAQTVRFASCIHKPSQEWIERAAQSFSNAMSPLLSLELREMDFVETNKKMLEDWASICKVAFDLTLYVRNSRDGIYSCKYPDKGSQLDREIAIPLGSEPCPAGARQNDICFVLAPAWIKYLPLEDITVVLEKGRVVIYKDS